MWLIIVQGFAAVYLLWMACVMKTENFRSSVIFKFIPAIIALPLAFGVVARLLGWPI